MKNKTTLYLLLLTLILAPLEISAANPFSKMKDGIQKVIISMQHKKANKKFEALAYARAIVKYEKIRKKDFEPDSLIRNLAFAYFRTNDTPKSEELYGKLINSSEYKEADVYYYAQSLKYNKKYSEADKWIEKYRELKGDDTRGELQHKAAPVIKEIYSEKKYRLEPAYFNTKYSEFGAVVKDEKVIFTSGRKDQAIIKYEYSWKGQPYLDMFSADIDEQSGYKKAKLLSKGLNSRFHDGPACYSADGQEIFMTRNNFNLGMPKYSNDKENHFLLYYAVKKDEDGWSELTELPFNSSEYSCGHPSISKDKRKLFFSSDMPGGFGGSDLYFVERTGEGWSEPVNLGADVNTEGDEMFPFISPDENLYFSSNGHLGLGGLDIFMAAPVGQGEYGILNMGYPLNSSADDFSFYLLDNGWDGYFASNRAGGKGEDDVYQFTMLNKPNLSFTLAGKTIDGKTGELLIGAKVTVVDGEGKELFNGISNEDGKAEIDVSPGKYYTINASIQNYADTTIKILADKKKKSGQTQAVDIPLKKIEEWGIYGFIFEKESGDGIEGAEILITDSKSGEIISDITDANGYFRKKLSAETDYDIILKKQDFFTKRGSFTTKDREPGWMDVQEFIEVKMEVIEVGKTIEIPNIYYDVGKWNIRPDAAAELEKVVQFLKDNKEIKIELGSHTDARGSNSSNQRLSQKRAESAVKFIVSSGIAKKRISAKGYGESYLKNHCANGVKCSKDEHQENRRTEIKVIGI